MSNFTPVKFIFPMIILGCFTFLIFPENSVSAEKYIVQVAATKTPLDLKVFIKKNGISDDITELKTDSLRRCIVGNFKDHLEASAYAAVFIEKTKLTNAFARVIDEEDTMKVVHTETNIDSIQLKKKEQIIANSNLAQQDQKNDGYKVKSELQENGRYPGSLLTGKKIIRIFLNDSKAEDLKNELITYGENHVPLYLRKLYLVLVNTFFQYPVIFIFILLILFFIVNIISVLLILNYTIKKKNQEARYVKIYSQMYEEALLSYMFGEIEWEKVIVKLKKINKPRNRKILTSILLNFHENLKGEVNKYIPEIFYNLGLYKDSFKYVKSTFTYKKVQGIRELTYLYPEGALQIVPDYVDYPDDKVRAEAQMAYIRLNENNPFAFLSSLTKSFTRWTQLSAFYMLRLYQLHVPSFADYLYSKHPTVRNFSLQMITYFQQLENVSEIFNMMKSKEERTRFLSYKAINDLRLHEGRVLIKKSYRKETIKNKLEIVKAFKNIGNAEDFEFLEEVIKSESVSLKTEACRSMYFMNQDGRERLVNLAKESYPEVEQLIAHVTDPRN